MNLLIYEWQGYCYTELKIIFKEMGIHYDVIEFLDCQSNVCEDFPEIFQSKLKETQYDAVFSFNYVVNVAEACYQHNVKYISWTYDSPLTLYKTEKSLSYPTTYAFFFDRKQTEYFQSVGLEHIYHLPLAANTKRLSQIQIPPALKIFYEADVSFVGNFYELQFPMIWKELSPYMQGYLKAAILAQQKLFGCNLYQELITDDILQRISYEYTKGNHTDYFSKQQVIFQMNAYTTSQERKLLLSSLANHCLTKLYTTNDNISLNNIINMGPVTYIDRMPMVFRTSKINLNITLRSIESGIPLRAIDILGSGGFLLSNYQPELAEYFIPDKEVVLYMNVEDAIDKARYYLKHDTLRQKIASAGYERVKNDFNYEKQLSFIFKTCGLY